MHVPALPDFLPGRLTLSRGVPADYAALARFHYCAGRPPPIAAVWTVRHRADDSCRPRGGRIVAVGVLSYPLANCHERTIALGDIGRTYRDRLLFINANLRTISRVVVHPQFRSAGLAAAVIRCLCKHCSTRYVEARARMGMAHPMFDAAGLTRVEPAGPNRPAYYWLDRECPSRRR